MSYTTWTVPVENADDRLDQLIKLDATPELVVLEPDSEQGEAAESQTVEVSFFLELETAGLPAPRFSQLLAHVDEERIKQAEQAGFTQTALAERLAQQVAERLR